VTAALQHTCPDGLQEMQYFRLPRDTQRPGRGGDLAVRELTRFVFAAQSRMIWPTKFNGMLYNTHHSNQRMDAPDHCEWGNNN
jgi:hypothetical protein